MCYKQTWTNLHLRRKFKSHCQGSNASCNIRDFCPTWPYGRTLVTTTQLLHLTGIADIPVVEDKAEIIEESHKRVEQITKQFRRGMIIRWRAPGIAWPEWCAARENWRNVWLLTKILRTQSLWMMDSGARGNISNFSQPGSAWFDGCLNGRIMELPTFKSREGLSNRNFP